MCLIYHIYLLYTTGTDYLHVFATCTKDRVPLRLDRTLAQTVHVHARATPVYYRLAGSCRIRLPVSPCTRPHASVSAAGPTDVVHLFTSVLGPTMEVTRNKKVVFLEDIPELRRGVSSGAGWYCECTFFSFYRYSTYLPGIGQPGFRHLCSPDSLYEGWLSDLGSRSPQPGGSADPRDRKLGRAAELRWDFLFPQDTWVRIPGFFLTWANAVGSSLGCHEGMVDTGLKQAVSRSCWADWVAVGIIFASR